MNARPVVAVALALLASACATTQQGTALKSDTYETRVSLTRELVAQGQWAAAFGYADGLHRERPRDPEALVLRGTVYRERGLWAEAEADLIEAVRLDGRSAEAHAALGILYDVTLRPDAAEPQHREANKLAPNQVGYLNNLGFCLFLRGKMRDAITFYEQAARLEPTSRRVRTNLGFAFAATGDLRRAAHEFEMGGTAAEAKNNLGFAYEQRGDFSHAYDLYLEATTLDPASTHARSNLVHAAHELGRPLPTAPPAPLAPAPALDVDVGAPFGPVEPHSLAPAAAAPPPSFQVPPNLTPLFPAQTPPSGPSTPPPLNEDQKP